jgi:hypothetical protein
MPILQTGVETVTFLPVVADFSLTAGPENHAVPGTPSVVEHYVGRAGPDPGYVNLPPSTVGIGGPLILLASQRATIGGSARGITECEPLNSAQMRLKNLGGINDGKCNQGER